MDIGIIFNFHELIFESAGNDLNRCLAGGAGDIMDGDHYLNEDNIFEIVSPARIAFATA
jgi:hypothetical protein